MRIFSFLREGLSFFDSLADRFDIRFLNYSMRADGSTIRPGGGRIPDDRNILHGESHTLTTGSRH